MKKDINKITYNEPKTMVANVESEGFVCASIVDLKLNFEVDEHVNIDNVDLEFNNDFEE